MKFFTRAVSVILSILLLLSLAACRNLPPPRRTPAEGSSPTTSDESRNSPQSPQNTDPADGADAVSSDSPQQKPVAVESVTITLDSGEVARGTTLSPKVVILPADATEKTFTLSSGDESIIRQDGGRLIAVGPGTTEIIATAANGVEGKTAVTVIVPVESVSLGSAEIQMAPGESLQLTPVISPKDATDTKAHFSSGNESVASVTEEGVVLAVSTGVSIISCAVGGVIAECTVNVQIPVTGINISADRRAYKVGEQGRFTVQITPQEATDKAFTVSISGPAASLTGDNTFSCDAAGEVTITVTTSNGMSAGQTITIVDLLAYAAEVFRLTNIEREKAGLPQFSSMPNLTQTAVVRANETIQHFSHDRPDGRSCFTAFDENNVDYRYAGENLAMGQKTPEEVVQGWMDSPGHRANILKSEFGHLGVGVVMDSSGRLYWTQMFTD